jgi:heptosyltransferase-2
LTTLVVQTAFLGDVVLTTPLIEVLAERHGPVDVVTTPAAAALLSPHPSVRRVIPHDKRGADRGPAGFGRLVAKLRAGGYDRAYLPHQSWRSALAVRLAGIPTRVGFASAGARWCYSERVPRPVDRHETARLLALAGVREPRLPSLGLTAAEFTEADAWLVHQGVAADFVAVAPGSIWGTKRWGKYPALASAMTRPIVVVGGESDRPLAEAVLEAAPGRSWDATGRLSLRGSAALIERALALVTNDSLPLHLAQAVGTPTVALFGPTVPAFGFGPRGPRDRICEVAGLACRPCSLHGPASCPLGHHRCMLDLDVARVVEALDALLSPNA